MISAVRTFLRNLPNQPVPVRRRFVLVATAATFLLVVVVWIGLLMAGRPAERASPPEAAGELPEGVATPEAPAPLPAEGELPSADFGDLSTDLLKAFGGGE